MPITERTLKRWRKEALDGDDEAIMITYRSSSQDLATAYIEYRKRILRMTQELLDAHLIRKK